MYKLLRKIKVFVCILCVLLSLGISYKMPDLIFAYENKKLNGKAEKLQIKEIDLNLYSDLDFFQKINLMNKGKPVVQLKNGVFLQTDTVLKKLYEGLDTLLSGTHGFTEKKPSMHEWQIKKCLPILYRSSSGESSFILWDTLVYSDAGTVSACIDDETGVILLLGYSIYKIADDNISYEGENNDNSVIMSNNDNSVIMSTEELVKRYIAYTSATMPEIMSEEKYSEYSDPGLQYEKYDGEVTEDYLNSGEYVFYIMKNSKIFFESTHEYVAIVPESNI